MDRIYYPSGVCQMHLRLEEGLGPLPSEALAVLQGFAVPDAGAPTGLLAFAPPTPGDPLSHITAVLPTIVDHERNGHRFADTLSLRVPFRDFPISPRFIRSLGVSWFGGTVSPSDYASGIRQSVSGAKGPNTAIVKPSRETLRFVGFADDIEEDLGNGNILLSCRDYTAILIDTRVKAQVLRDLDIDGALDEVILELLRTLPGGAAGGLTVRADLWLDEATGLPEPMPNVAKLFPRTIRTKKGKVARLVASYAGADVSYWDLITDLCGRAGYLPTIEEDTLVITTPRNLFAGSGSGTFSRIVQSNGKGELLTVRRMIYGYNLKSLRFTRKFGRITAPTVEVRSTSPGQRLPLIARWPPTTKATHVLPSGKGAQEKTELVIVKGIPDMATLLHVAESIYEEMGRAEFGGQMETYDLASFGGDNADPDLLALRSADPIEVVVQHGGTQTGIMNYLSGPQEHEAGRQIERLEGKGIRRDVAKALVQIYWQTRGLQKVFRTRDVTYNWQLGGTNPALRIGARFGTYMEVRSNAHLASALEQGITPSSTKATV